jgi:hypothetical protein
MAGILKDFLAGRERVFPLVSAFKGVAAALAPGLRAVFLEAGRFLADVMACPGRGP